MLPRGASARAAALHAFSMSGPRLKRDDAGGSGLRLGKAVAKALLAVVQLTTPPLIGSQTLDSFDARFSKDLP